MNSSPFKRLLLFGLLLLGTTSARSQGKPLEVSRDYFPVVSFLYATDRVPTKDSFMGKSASTLSYGEGRYILHLHYFRKSEPVQKWWRPRNPTETKLGLQPVERIDEKSFDQALRNSADNQTFLYVHGFSTSFDEGAKEAAQIAYDLQLPGKPLLYSWPSNGSISVGDYNADEARVNNPGSIRHLRTFIQEVLRTSGRGRIDLVGFSMGTYLLTRALMELADEGQDFSKVGAVILISADIDAEDFKTLYYPKLKKALGSKLTLYVSGRDEALELSAHFHHDRPRLGQGDGKTTLIDGLTTIDATQSSQDCGICHGLSQINGVINDMYLSLRQDIPLKKRLLDDYENDGKKYYMLFDNVHSIETIQDHNFAIAGQLETYLNTIKFIWLPTPALEIAAGINHGFLPTELELRWNLQDSNLRLYLNAGIDYYDQGNGSTAWAAHGGPGLELVSDSGLGLSLEWDGVAELSRSSAVVSGSYLDRLLTNDGSPFSGFRLQLIKYFDFNKLLN